MEREVAVGESGSETGRACAAGEFVHVHRGHFPVDPEDGLEEFVCVMNAFHIQNPDLWVLWRVSSIADDASSFTAIKKRFAEVRLCEDRVADR